MNDGATRTENPLALVQALENDHDFRRDSGLGAILRPGKVSFRERTSRGSLHIIISGNRVSAHVDGISPLRCRGDGTACYSVGRVVAHNLSWIAAELRRRLRGRPADHRCNLHCEAVWVDDDLDVEIRPTEPSR